MMDRNKPKPKGKQGDIAKTNTEPASHAPRPVLMAKTMTLPAMRGADTIKAFSEKTHGEIDWSALLDTLEQQNDKVQRGDMKQAEALLMTQAHTLDAMFHELARRSALYMDEQLTVTERYLRLALKAQSQCRTTLETLAEIKNPPVVIARQANIAHGHQQVNNGMPIPNKVTVAHAENPESRRNELLEVQHGERLDTGTTGAAIAADPAMASLDEIHRPPKP